MKKIILLSIISLIITAGCSVLDKNTEDNQVRTNNETGTFTDPRDNQTYKTVKIGNQLWMAQNLNYEAPESFYYKNTSRNAEFFGRLYTWNAAMNACPAGWHLPTDDEWIEMEVYLGISAEQAEDSDWRGIDQGERLMVKGNTGFNAMLGGYRNITGEFAEMDEIGTYWTATELGKNDAWGRGFEVNNPQISKRTFGKSYSFSVRCVKNEE